MEEEEEREEGGEQGTHVKYHIMEVSQSNAGVDGTKGRVVCMLFYGGC